MRDIEVTMERLTLDDLPRCETSSVFTIREYQPGDEVSWTYIQTDADRYNSIKSTLFAHEFGSDQSEHKRRILFAVTPDQELVGTSAAWWGSSSADEWGRVHWVAVLPRWQRRGIGRSLLVATCHRLREVGHRKAFLTTSPVRLEALRLYLSIGFVPRLGGAEDRETWHEIASAFGDSALTSWLERTQS